MPLNLNPDQMKAYQLFFPHASQRTLDFIAGDRRFAHYTSAAVALSIIQNKSVWMRNARTMNDFSEIEHGKECLVEAYRSAAGQTLRAFLDRLHTGFTQQLEELFNGWLPDLDANTFITCVSEHLDTEDQLGRLSMWRAYSRQNGVALVFRNTPFVSQSDVLKAYSSPVAYLDKPSFQEAFTQLATNIQSEETFVAAIPRENLLATLFTAFRFAVLCTKHPGFWEEKEWRVVYSPGFEKSEYITVDLEVVRDIPQRVCKIPLQNVPDGGLVGAAVPDLLDRVIIGPTEYGFTMFDAFVEALAAAGVDQPESKVVLSTIPIRDW